VLHLVYLPKGFQVLHYIQQAQNIGAQWMVYETWLWCSILLSSELTKPGEAHHPDWGPLSSGRYTVQLWQSCSCILLNSPIIVFWLRSNILLSQIEKNVVIADEKYTPTEHFSLPKQLRTFKIKWHTEKKMVKKIIKILKTYGVPREQISIEKFDPPESKLFITPQSNQSIVCMRVHIYLIFKQSTFRNSY